MNVAETRALKAMIKKDGLVKTVLTLWDSTTESLRVGVLDRLKDGKSELATLMLASRIEIMRGQSRNFLYECLHIAEGKRTHKS